MRQHGHGQQTLRKLRQGLLERTLQGGRVHERRRGLTGTESRRRAARDGKLPSRRVTLCSGRSERIRRAACLNCLDRGVELAALSQAGVAVLILLWTTALLLFQFHQQVEGAPVAYLKRPWEQRTGGVACLG